MAQRDERAGSSPDLDFAGKLGGEFYTPRCLVRLLTKLGFTLEARP